MLKNDISIWLDNYDDIFSDFDPRSYSERVLSDDFLLEIRKVCGEKDEAVNVFNLLLPVNKRNQETEGIIIKRLQSHFKQNYYQYRQQYKNTRKKGIFLSILGMSLMLFASYLSSLNSRVLLLNAILVMVEPSGWFLVWYGLDQIFYHSKQNKSELVFYKKIVKSKITFSSIH